MTVALPPQNSNKKHHFLWIDLLRGASALAIVLFHVRINLWVGWKEIQLHPSAYSALDRATAYLSVATPFFGAAVMLFFLVSGFCVHFAYAAGERPFQLGPYAKRRFFRIYPPYLAIVAVTLIVQQIVSIISNVNSSPWPDVVETIFMVQNYGLSIKQIFGNISLWSLPVEAELYLVYPLFLYFSLSYGYKKTLFFIGLVSGIAFALSLRFGDNIGLLHFSRNFLLYWIIWCGGAFLAEAIKSERLPRWTVVHFIIMWGLAGVGVLSSLKHLPANAQSLLWASFYFMLMLWGLSNPKIGNWPKQVMVPLLWIGQLSYSLYLIHMPFFLLCGTLWQHQFGGKPANFLVTLIFAGLSLLPAFLFYRYIELPCHTWARKFGAARRIVVAA